ncbi:hypothetical protein D3C73_1377340 [compost metagenome]
MHLFASMGVIGNFLFNFLNGIHHPRNIGRYFACTKRQIIRGTRDLRHDNLELMVLVFNASAGIGHVAGNLGHLSKDAAQLVNHAVKGAA